MSIGCQITILLHMVTVKTISSVKDESILFRIINRHYEGTYAMVDKKFCVSGECNHCGLCEKECPVSNIKLVGGKPEWQHQCESCLKYIQFCPKNAINYGSKTFKRKRYTLNYEEFLAIGNK